MKRLISAFCWLFIYFSVIGLLTSCSASWHLKQAINKGYTITTDTLQSDTITKHDTLYDFIEVPYDNIIVKDSIWCDSNNVPQSKLGSFTESGDRSSLTGHLDSNGVYTLIAGCDSLEIEYERQISKTSVVTNKLQKQIDLSNRLQEKLNAKPTYLIHWIITLVILGGLIFAYIKK